MASALRQARKELRDGDRDAALALLWNALEPARLAGDRRALRTIEGMAVEVARTGDEAHRREAERLAEAAHAAAEVPGAARLDADVSTGGAAPPPAETGGAEGEGQEGGGGGAQRIASLVWLLLIIAVVIANVLGGGRQ